MLGCAHFLKIGFPGVGGDKILDFHLGTFAVAENEIAWTDFIPESLALLGKTEWK